MTPINYDDSKKCGIDTSMNEMIKTESKHNRLDYAVNDISQLTEHANMLLRRITNQEETEECVKEEKPHKPSLAEILELSSERINIQCQEIHKILDEISSELF